MLAKDFLLKGRHIKEEVDELKRAKQQAYDLACGISAAYSDIKVQTSFGNSTEEKFVAYTNYSALLDYKIKELLDYQKKMQQLINQVDNSICRTLLIARYITCKTWERIAEDMGYSDKWVRTGLHSASLKAFQKVLNKKKDEDVTPRLWK